MMNIFKKLLNKSNDLDINDNEIISPLAGKIINLKTVSDPLFAQQIMGKTIAIKSDKDTDIVNAPVTGKIKVFYPTGHAFGIENDFGLEVLVHIGINTVNTKGVGFELLGHGQGERIKAGTSLVKVDFKKISKSYDTTVFVVITKNITSEVEFKSLNEVETNQIISI